MLFIYIYTFIYSNMLMRVFSDFNHYYRNLSCRRVQIAMRNYNNIRYNSLQIKTCWFVVTTKIYCRLKSNPNGENSCKNIRRRYFYFVHYLHSPKQFSMYKDRIQAGTLTHCWKFNNTISKCSFHQGWIDVFELRGI